MIYCDLLEKRKDSVVYTFSSGIGECGKIEFLLHKLGEPKILEEPEKHYSKYYLGCLYFKYYNRDFKYRRTPSKISYEI